MGHRCPDSSTLRLAFTRTEQRTQRLSDGTVVVEAHRFEVPNCYRHLSRLQVRYASWDLAHVHLVDERTGAVLARLFPQDKVANARGRTTTTGAGGHRAVSAVYGRACAAACEAVIPTGGNRTAAAVSTHGGHLPHSDTEK